jgi:predicted RNA binding protein YcfA (HicA-like mRNA interferase family)
MADAGECGIERLATKDERLRRLCAAPAEMEFPEVAGVLDDSGWRGVRQSGSHHVWRGPQEQSTSIPTVGGRKVKRVFLRKLCDLIRTAEAHKQQTAVGPLPPLMPTGHEEDP